MTDPSRLVIEAGARLRVAEARLPAALRSLAASMPGYPSSTGGGRGGGRTITVEGERVPVTSVEALAFGFGRDGAVVDRRMLGDDLRVCCARLAELGALAGLEALRVPGRPDSDADFVEALDWCLQAVEYLGRGSLPMTGLRAAERLLAASTGVYGTVGEWSVGRKPTKADTERAVAPSEVWCTHCRAHGVMQPRKRDRDGRGHGELCAWCLDYRASSGHLPPAALVRMRGDGRRILGRDIARHDPAYARAIGAA